MFDVMENNFLTKTISNYILEFAKDQNGSQEYLYNLQKKAVLPEKLVSSPVIKYSVATMSISLIFFSMKL